MKDTDFGRAIAVLVSPTKTFRSIVERPTWWAPYVVILGLTAVTLFIQEPKIDWQATIDTKLERSDRVESAELELILDFLEKHGTAVMVGTALVLVFVIYPLMAVLFRFLFQRMGGKFSFRTSLAVFLHGFMPWAIAYVLLIPRLLRAETIDLYDPGRLVPNLTAFAGRETGLELWLLLNSIDLFSLWTMALLTIGYSIAAGITRLRAAVGVVGLWALWVAIMIGMAALG